ncbi:TPA: 3-oxoacyl-[acyl-carrier-protein] reductase [Candidatus Poribacteria bacterium]|nr:3-oxoacyl-[acyl-carrier-protein] reductase [Candidatus Poribacteria bacterium]HEX30414.1 3-oxoacyl-[acyl-carrier-protein] reductase [Candidatus Poribacteria bacterium]
MILKDKVAIITGSARGIGKSIATLFARQGAKVVISDIADEIGEKTAQEIRELGGEAIYLHCDVSDPEDVERLIRSTVESFGRLDILVNNAGITRDSLLVRMRDEDWNRVISINLTGTFNCTRAAAKVMMRQRDGCIINIASVAGIMGNVGQVNYSASKAGVIGITKSAARELAGRGVRVNAIAPGFIMTEMTAKLPEAERERILEMVPLGKPGTPEDVANVALFLASDAARYITGQVIRVDGGMVMG